MPFKMRRPICRKRLQKSDRSSLRHGAIRRKNMLDRIASRADYDRLRQTFQWDRREYFNFGDDVVDAWAARRPDQPALWWDGPHGLQKRTWSEMSVRSNQVAQVMTGLDLQRGE